MTIEFLSHSWSVCVVADLSELPLSDPFFFVGKTDEEISLVCPTDSVPLRTLRREDGWSAMRIRGVLDFSLIGVLAKLTALLAEQKISVFVLSTYNTDYVLVKEENKEHAKELFVADGYCVEELSY